MPLGSLPPDSLFPGSAACPTSCPLHGPVALRPRSRLISHPGTRPPLAFFVAPRAAIAPVGCSFADSASARAETRSSTASLRSHSPIAAASTNFISFRFSATCSASAVLRRDPPTREWPSAISPRHLSETNSRTPFSPRSFRYRRNAVQLAFFLRSFRGPTPLCRRSLCYHCTPGYKLVMRNARYAYCPVICICQTVCSGEVFVTS
jgi:hypothetical protein